MNSLKKLDKAISFLDFMVKSVFVSTFIYTIIVVIISYTKDWESVLITLTERWFTIMVGELIVTGIIQIIKDIVQGIIRWLEIKAEKGESKNGI